MVVGKNTNFIWLGGVVYNLGRFDFVHEFKELDETGKFTSLKEDFEDIIELVDENRAVWKYGVFLRHQRWSIMLQRLIWEILWFTSLNNYYGVDCL